MIREVAISGQMARLWMKGILLVRMTWMISVWVKSDSTNRSLWKSAGLDAEGVYQTARTYQAVAFSNRE